MLKGQYKQVTLTSYISNSPSSTIICIQKAAASQLAIGGTNGNFKSIPLLEAQVNSIILQRLKWLQSHINICGVPHFKPATYNLNAHLSYITRNYAMIIGYGWVTMFIARNTLCYFEFLHCILYYYYWLRTSKFYTF